MPVLLLCRGAATIRTVLDERGRELCGEFTRFFDLKRTGMYKDASYLQSTFPELAGYLSLNTHCVRSRAIIQT